MSAPAVAPELDALVRACFATPKQNLPRLVLADYLDEHGQPDRATILRIQCERPPPKKGETPVLTRGAAKELRAAQKRALAPLEPLRWALGPLPFTRGFLSVSMVFGVGPATDDGTFALLRGLFAGGWVETFTVQSLQLLSPRLTELARLAGVLEVNGGQLHAETLAQLAAECRPGLPGCRLREVRLPPDARRRFARLTGTAKAKPKAERRQFYRHLTPATAELVAASGALDGVRELILGGEPGEDGFRRLVEHPAIRELDSLALSGLNVPPAALRHLWAVVPEHLGGLTVNAVPLGDDGIRDLLAGSFLPRHSLSLTRNAMTDASVPALVGCRALGELTALCLRGSLTAGGVAELLRAPTFAGLAVLDVDDADIPAPDLAAAAFVAPHRPELNVHARASRVVLSRPMGRLPALWVTSRYGRLWNWPAGRTCPEPLAALGISPVRFDADDLANLAAWLDGRPVPELTVHGHNLAARDADGLAALLALVSAARPVRLTLRGMDLGIAACRQLAASAALGTVEALDLTGNPLRLNGALAVAKSSHRGNLRTIRVADCGLTAKELTRIRAAFGDVAVTA